MSDQDAQRHARRQALLQHIQAALQKAAERMVDAVNDAPDHEMFRAAELQLRDAAHELVTQVHQAGLDARKKGATEGPQSSAPTAMPTLDSSPTDPAHS